MSKLGFFNRVLFQWFFVRLARKVDMDGFQRGWCWITRVYPLTGWSSPYKFVGMGKNLCLGIDLPLDQYKSMIREAKNPNKPSFPRPTPPPAPPRPSATRIEITIKKEKNPCLDIKLPNPSEDHTLMLEAGGCKTLKELLNLTWEHEKVGNYYRAWQLARTWKSMFPDKFEKERLEYV